MWAQLQSIELLTRVSFALMHSYTVFLSELVFPQWVLCLSLPVLTELTAHLYQAHY